MEIEDGGERWEATDGSLRVGRSTDRTADGVLVELTFENTGERELQPRIVEDVPGHVDDVSLITTAGGDPNAWRLLGDWIVHEAAVPPGATRSTAYLLAVPDDVSLSLPAPEIRMQEATERDSALTTPERESRRRVTNGGRSARLAIATADDGPTEVSLPSASTDGSDTRSPVKELIDALETDASPAQRRTLQSELGFGPAERARFEYVRSRLDDLAAYVDALEVLLDEHGIDAFGRMREDLDTTRGTVAAHDETLEDLAETLEQHREWTDEKVTAVEAEIAAVDANAEDRIADVESSLDAVSDRIETLQSEQRSQQQGQVRRTRRLEERLDSMAQDLHAIEARLQSTESDVDRFEDFHERFTAAFTSGDSVDRTETSDEPSNRPQGATE